MSKRGITIVIVLILGALALATWGGTKLGNSSVEPNPEGNDTELAALTSELAQVKDDYTILQQNNEELNALLASTKASLLQAQSNYTALQQEKSDIQAQLNSVSAELTQAQLNYANLQSSNSRLQTQLTSAANEISSLQAEYRDLEDDYDSILEELSDTKDNYDYLSQQYSALEGIKQFTVDSRLHVTLSTEMQSGKTVWVRGEVTNISSQTISRVYVLVSRYNANGTLDSLDLPPSVILNLAPGDIGYFSYFTTGEQCKITILGDY